MTAYAWRFALCLESAPGANSTTNELVPAKRWFCQFGAVPCGQRILAKAMLEKCANFFAAGTLCPGAHDRLRLVVPDRQLRLEILDEPPHGAGLGFRPRTWARVLGIPAASDRDPLRAEVPVQVDTAAVL